jgi:hypothetical protein
VRALIVGVVVLWGCGDDSVQRDAQAPDAASEGGAPNDGGGDGAASDANESCVAGMVVHAPGDGGVLGRNRLVSDEADGGVSVREAEPAIAASDQNAAVVAYVATDSSAANFIGTVRLDASGNAGPPSPPTFGFGNVGATRQTMPSLAYSVSTHRFYLAWLSYDVDAASGVAKNATVQVATSNDDGATWQGPVRADDPADSGTVPGTGPDKPWLVTSPRDGSVWLAYRSGRDALIRVRSAPANPAPPQFTTPSVLVFDPRNLPPGSDPDLAIGANGRPRIAVADTGDVLVTWIHVLGDVQGSDHNSVQFARMPVSLGAFGTPVTVNAASERVVFDDAPVVVGPGGATVFVGYVINLAQATPTMALVPAWEVRIARSVDGVSFATRTSPAGEPSSFAGGCIITRMRPSLALQRLPTGVVRLHVAFYDNRYGSGYTAADPGLGAFVYTYTDSTGFQAVQYLNDADFSESIVDSGPLWLGDYTALAVTPGSGTDRRLFSAWTDTRTGVGHVAIAAGSTP